VQDGLVRLRLHLLKPRQQSRSKIEADVGVVISNFLYIAIAIQDSRCSVWRVTFGCNAFVPVMVGVGGVLQFDKLKPCVLPRRLIKVPVNTDVPFHQSSISFSNRRPYTL